MTPRPLWLMPAALATLCVAAAGPVRAQAGGELPPASTAPWLVRWSALPSTADLPRLPPEPPAGGSLLASPPPRLGLFWIGGNPGAIPFETTGAWAEMRLPGGESSGAFQRPLDAPQSYVAGSGFGWRSLGGAGTGVGRVLVSRENLTPASRTWELRAFSSSPFIAVDSVNPDMARTRLQLEGAAGWTTGSWGLGFGAALETVTQRTERTPLPRSGRAATPAVTAGITRRLGGSVLAGAHARWRGRNEDVNVIAVGASGVVHPIRGFDEPVPFVVTTATPFLLRIEEHGWAAGAGAGTSAGRLRWMLAAELGQLEERRSLQRSDDPPLDTWSADMVRAAGGIEYDVALLGLGGVAQFSGEWRTLDGFAQRPDLTGAIFRADEERWHARARLWLPPPADGGWGASAVLGFEREDRNRRDIVAAAAAAIGRSRLEAGAAGAWRSAGGLGLSLDYAAALGFTSSTLPELTGDAVEAVVLPELLFYATPYLAHAVRAGAAWAGPGSTGFALEVAAGWLSPRGEEVASAFTGASRRTLQASLTVVLP